MKRTRLRRLSPKRKDQLVRLMELRLYVLERDGYACRHCHLKGPLLDAHHIQKRSQAPHRLLDATNIVTLCRTCHDWTDAPYGAPEGRLVVTEVDGVVAFYVAEGASKWAVQRQTARR